MDDPSHAMPQRRSEERDRDILDPRGALPGPLPRPGGIPGTYTGRYVPPISALGPLFRYRFEKIHRCRVGYDLDINPRPTTRVLGGYYKSRALVRVYVRDRELGLRPLEELFDTFLHELAHHLEYTEPSSFAARACGRVPGRMHSRLFWKILGELKHRWALLQRADGDESRRPV
ncbi:hypothetical protein OJF2_54750 [Aquisphaera giovannonii]|uniref:SprT-like family protein n=1 Tax=Aquisphaera giovannonii TaxID=406548 RepID=A0A5B9WAI5_9BACT|nr:hypothetical protein [Aquisphaera giovannonii]QEH36890.1 hypothetical protein OJF2_54750 [Aquisphaera giovannonii]